MKIITFYYRPALHKWRYIGQTYEEVTEPMPTEYFEAFQLLRAAMTSESSTANIPGLGNIRVVGFTKSATDPSYTVVLKGE